MAVVTNLQCAIRLFLEGGFNVEAPVSLSYSIPTVMLPHLAWLKAQELIA
jgi:hypothetical protein